MRVRTFRGIQQNLGALDPGVPKPLPNDLILFFPHVAKNSVLHTRGLDEPLRIYLLNSKYRLANPPFEMPPEGATLLGEKVCHVVETSSDCPVIALFDFLKKYT